MTFMLAACPWCGQPAKIRRVSESARDASGHARFNFVECSSTACAMMGPTCSDPIEAAQAWNRIQFAAAGRSAQ